MIKGLKKEFIRSRDEFEVAGEFPNEAGILIPVTNDPNEPEIILTKRAEHLNTHSGEVSFPGGKWEAADPTLVVTALRESEEEIGLPMQQVQVVAIQEPVYSLWNIKVTPYVGLIPADIPLIPNPDELDALFRVPVDYFLADPRVHTHVYLGPDGESSKEFWAPVYEFQGYRIWGLTARVLVEFLNQAFDAGIRRDHSAPEVMRPRRVRLV